ncbi:MAG TPA: kynureninase, partial [Alphaproteobacteria bacterium]|nr:kynureninase [Alphaproteobacteria bacterium]
MPSRADLESLDRADPLARFRDLFALPEGVIYLDGNSLGAQPRQTAARLAEVVEREWGRDLITSWNRNGWIDYPARLGGKVARLIGADADEVLVCDTTSINLFKALTAALDQRPDRRVILADRANFPSDLYIAEGLARRRPDATVRLVEETELAGAIDDSVAVVTLTQVNYKTGYLHDMAALTRAAHEAGALVVWDLAHSAGALPIDLNGAGADYAVGCGYKYLNGGPCAPAFLYVARRHQAKIDPPLPGWLGHAEPFAFDTDYRPAEGMRRNLCSMPSILASAALEVGLDLMLDAGIYALRTKSLALTETFIRVVERRCPGLFDLATPRDPARRGSQVSLRHPEGYAIVQALIARGVIG